MQLTQFDEQFVKFCPAINFPVMSIVDKFFITTGETV